MSARSPMKPAPVPFNQRTLDARVEALSSHIGQIAASKTDERLKSILATLSELQESYTSLRQAYLYLQQEGKVLMENHQMVLQQLAALDHHYRDLVAQHEDLLSQYDQTTAELQEANDKIADLQVEKDNLVARVDNMLARMEKLEAVNQSQSDRYLAHFFAAQACWCAQDLIIQKVCFESKDPRREDLYADFAKVQTKSNLVDPAKMGFRGILSYATQRQDYNDNQFLVPLMQDLAVACFEADLFKKDNSAINDTKEARKQYQFVLARVHSDIESLVDARNGLAHPSGAVLESKTQEVIEQMISEHVDPSLFSFIQSSLNLLVATKKIPYPLFHVHDLPMSAKGKPFQPVLTTSIQQLNRKAQNFQALIASASGAPVPASAPAAAPAAAPTAVNQVAQRNLSALQAAAMRGRVNGRGRGRGRGSA